MTLVSENVEADTRERILAVAERLFREIGYQKTTVADIAKVLRMSPANVYRFFDSKKAINEGVARGLMGGVEDAAVAIAGKRGSAASRLRELLTAIHRMNSERYVGDSKLHEMVEIAMQESWEVCVAHMERVTETIGAVIADGAASGEFAVDDVAEAAMCWAASSSATFLVRAATATLRMLPIVEPVDLAASPEMLTILPPPRAAMWGATSRMQRR